MLQNLRDNLGRHRWLGWIGLAALVFVFVLWGPSTQTASEFFGVVSYGLKVNGEEISSSQLQQQWQEQYSRYQQAVKGEVPAAMRATLQQQFVDNKVRQILLQQRASEQGFRVSDATVRTAFQGEQAFQVDGKYNKDAAAAALASVGLTAAGYEAQLKRDLAIQQLEQSLLIGDFITPSQLARAATLQNEQRELRHALLPLAKYSAAVQVEPAKVQAWYDAHVATSYMTAESVKLQYAELRLDAVAGSVPAGEADLKAWYEKNQSRYVEPEKRRARHILVADEKTAQQVMAELKVGGDFAKLAAKYSQDTGSARQGGDLGFAASGAYVKEFEAALLALKKGETTAAPVKTQFGYHIIRLDDVQGGKSATLADSRARIEADYKRERATDLFGERQEQLQQKLEAGAGDIAALAKEYGLTVGVVDDYTRANGGALGVNADLVGLVFSDRVIKDQRIGGPVALGKERIVIVKALEHRVPKARPLAEVRADVEAAVRREAGIAAVRAAAEAAAKRLTAGESFDAVAKSLGVPAGAAVLVTRAGTVDAKAAAVPPAVRDAAFSLPAPEAGKAAYTAVAMDDGGAAVVAVLSAKAGVAATDATANQRLASQLSQQQAQADVNAYLTEVQRHAKVKVNKAVFD